MGLGPWRDVALILLILETALVILPAGILLYAAVRGLQAANRFARQYLPIARERVQQIATATDRLCRRAVDPLLTLGAWRAQAGAIRSASQQALQTRRNR